MDLRPFLLAGLLGVVSPAQGPAAPPAAAEAEDPFYLPPEAQAFTVKAAAHGTRTQTKLQDLLRMLFDKREDGGFGLIYDNSRTRTVAEVWKEGKANCLSLTAFFVAACRALGLKEEYAEALNTNHWRKEAGIVRYERHVVALNPSPPSNDMIADFVPELRKRFGLYRVVVLPDARFKALFYSNRAVESLTDGSLDVALGQARLSLESDPTSSVGWNIQGVVQAARGDLVKAEEAYRKAVELDPKDGAPIGNLEALLRETGRDVEAQTYRRLGETVRIKDPFFHAFLAEEALAEGNQPEAATRIRAALKLLPRDPDILLLDARILLAGNDLDGALKALQIARKWADPSEAARYNSKLAIIQGMKSGRAER